MSLIAYLILLALGGLIVGALARLALPGKDPLSLFQTMLVGWAGSFGAGLLCILLFGRNYGGITLSIVGATVVMYFVRRSRGGGLLDPGDTPDRLGR
jgi:uncharacterized membrane protein YeaQ/YmgE (transglycosylase-associated protein family)